MRQMRQRIIENVYMATEANYLSNGPKLASYFVNYLQRTGYPIPTVYNIIVLCQVHFTDESDVYFKLRSRETIVILSSKFFVILCFSTAGQALPCSFYVTWIRYYTLEKLSLTSTVSISLSSSTCKLWQLWNPSRYIFQVRCWDFELY